jgi:hypothetical protein
LHRLEMEPFTTDSFLTLQSDDKDEKPQNLAAPKRRGSSPRRRSDPLHYMGETIQGKKQDSKKSQV